MQWRGHVRCPNWWSLRSLRWQTPASAPVTGYVTIPRPPRVRSGGPVRHVVARGAGCHAWPHWPRSAPTVAHRSQTRPQHAAAATDARPRAWPPSHHPTPGYVASQARPRNSTHGLTAARSTASTEVPRLTPLPSNWPLPPHTSNWGQKDP